MQLKYTKNVKRDVFKLLSKGIKNKRGKPFPYTIDLFFRFGFGYKRKFTYLGLDGFLDFIPDNVCRLDIGGVHRDLFREAVFLYIKDKTNDFTEEIRYTVNGLRKLKLEFLPLEVIREINERRQL